MCVCVQKTNPVPVSPTMRLEFDIPPPKASYDPRGDVFLPPFTHVPGFGETPFFCRGTRPCLGRSAHGRYPSVPTGHLPLQASSLHRSGFHMCTAPISTYPTAPAAAACCYLLTRCHKRSRDQEWRVEGEQRRHSSESETSEPNHAEPKQTRRIDSCCSLLVASLLKSQISSRAVWLTC